MGEALQIAGLVASLLGLIWLIFWPLIEGQREREAEERRFWEEYRKAAWVRDHPDHDLWEQANRELLEHGPEHSVRVSQEQHDREARRARREAYIRGRE